jgi:hypothetical protein
MGLPDIVNRTLIENQRCGDRALTERDWKNEICKSGEK